MDKLQKWGKELTSNISDVLEQSFIRQGIINDFLCKKLSCKNQALLIDKLIAHDKQTKEDRDAIKQAEVDMLINNLKMKENKG